MPTRLQQLSLLAALPILLAGCSTVKAGGPTAALPPPASSPAAPTGTSMTGMTTLVAPSESAQMVCGPEIRADVATILSLKTPPPTATSWVNQLYTCTYRLSGGPLAVSVKESGDVTSARSYFDGLRRRLGPTQPLRGLDSLGLPAFETPNGNVAFLKDDKTLQIDATALPTEVNSQHRQRSDLAYTLATDILGCWSGK
ncbi:MAG: hypothetical protein QOJ32_3252 [Frankiaceae bacterium]|nr:hypothetical protein [Frankiaceae bacterium]